MSNTNNDNTNVFSRKFLAVNLILTQILIIITGIVLLNTLFKDVAWQNFFRVNNIVNQIAPIIIGCMGLTAVQGLFLKFVPKEKLIDEINVLLMENFSLLELTVIFFFGAATEEFLFRGIIQSALGIVLTSLLFTLIHFRYWRKVYMMIEVFFMGIVLGLIYAWTDQLWVSAFCHFAVNVGTAYMVKKGYIDYKV